MYSPQRRDFVGAGARASVPPRGSLYGRGQPSAFRLGHRTTTLDQDRGPEPPHPARHDHRPFPPPSHHPAAGGFRVGWRLAVPRTRGTRWRRGSRYRPSACRAFGLPKAEAPAGVTAAPRRVFLQEIRVRGFCGIGPKSTLSIAPGPGLTLVVGRNGCGKSSFAEAAEWLVTHRNMRWGGRSKPHAPSQ